MVGGTARLFRQSSVTLSCQLKFSKESEGIYVTNPFDDTNATFRILVNDLQQHSLWPSFADVPKGWMVMFGPDGRQECLDFVSRSWTDMTPRTVAELAASQ
ncbi:MbtH family protein [Arthrobacter glacialis]|uniref:MbtH family protein n=1 Tax=Arthrobacter glacialis TaxID=1664 RepID=UPI0027953724|nr:MbtH family protein [Arthrobacter glacialis]